MNLCAKSAALAGALLISCVSAAGATTLTEPGIWHKHEYSFVFMGFTSTYSCDGLADKIQVLLLAAGARGDAKSRPGACAAGFGRPDKFARADLTFYTLSPDDSQGHGNGESVAGVWRSVRFADRSPREIAIGDCELIEQFRHSVLPMFTTRLIDDHITCIPNQESGSIIALSFDSFSLPGGRALPDKSGGAH